MKIRNLVLGIAAGMALLGAASVSAETITSADGVLSIDTPSDEWTQKTDSKALLEITDGKNSITIEHLSNGEALPAQEIADEKNPDVYVSLISTKNEVFSVKGLAVDAVDLQTIIKTAGTIKILKFDTKTAVIPVETKKAEESGKKDEAAAEQNTEAVANGSAVTVYDADGMSVELYFDEATGEYKDANGNVFLTMAGSVFYQPDSNSYWSADKDYWLTHSEDELNYDEVAAEKSGMAENAMVLYNEAGESVTVLHSSETGNCEDENGLEYLAMAGGLFYQPDTDSYWDTDPNYWTEHTEDELDYEEMVDELNEDDTVEDAEEVYDDAEEDLDDFD